MLYLNLQIHNNNNDCNNYINQQQNGHSSNHYNTNNQALFNPATHLSAFNPKQIHYNQTSSNNYGYTTYANLTPSQYQTQSLISYENIQKNYTTLQPPPTINKNTASAVSLNDSNTKDDANTNNNDSSNMDDDDSAFD